MAASVGLRDHVLENSLPGEGLEHPAARAPGV